MTLNNPTGYWSVTLTNAQPNHEYKYFLRWSNNTAGSWKHDPRTVWIRNGNSVVYDHSVFAWSNATSPTIPFDQQVMYEMHIGSFYDPNPSDGIPGTFDDAITRLDYLKRLGVNVIALMPVNEFGGNFSWGYNPEHLFAVEAAYGGPDGLKRFVRAAHQKGMKVQLDVVHNHWNAPADGLWEFDGTNNIYFYGDEPKGWTAWGRRPNYDQPEVRALIREQTQMLIENFQIDGLRWDSPQNIVGYDANGTKTNVISNNEVRYIIGNPQTVITNGWNLMRDINRMIRTNTSTAYLNRWSIAEDADLLVPTSLVQYNTNTFWGQLQVTNTNETFHGHWQTSFHNEITPQIASPDPSLDTINNKINAWSEPPGWRVIFTDNHDKAGKFSIGTDSNNPLLGWRLANRMDPSNQAVVFATNQTSLLRTNSMVDPVTPKRVLLNAVLTLTAPGIPMLWMGQEFGATDTFTDQKRLDWREASRQSEVFRAHRDLIFLRTNLPALRLLTLATNNNSRITGNLLTYWHANDVFVALNFSSNNTSLVLSNLPSNTNWFIQLHTDWRLYGGNTAVSTNPLTVTSNLALPAYSAAILAKTPSGIQLTNPNAMIPEGWMSLFGVIDPNADDDADGMPVEFEYRNGLDPLERDVATISFDGGVTRLPMSSYREAFNATNQYLLWAPRAGSSLALPKYQLGTNSIDGQGTTNPARTYLRFTYHLTSSNSSATFFTPNTNLAVADANRAHWASFYGVTDFNANPDGDAFTNLQEFARGSDPNVSNRASLWLAGTRNGWNESNQPMVFLGNRQWSRYLWATNGSLGEFKVTVGSWSTAWGETNNPPDFIGDASASAPNIKVNFTNGTGFYRFDFDEDTQRYGWILDNSPTEMTIAGTGFAFSDSPSNTLASNMTWNSQRGQFEWLGVATSSPVSFRFVRPLANSNWDVSWGLDPAGPTNKVLPNTTTNHSANTTNVSVSLATGFRYRISFKPADLSIGIAQTTDQLWLNSNNPTSLPAASFWTNDTDGDGYVQLIEYALGGNPNLAETNQPISFWATNSNGSNRLVLQWMERTNGESSLQITPVLGTNLMEPLASWSVLTSSLATNTSGVANNFVRKEASVAIDSTNRKFLRLRVTGP